MHNLLGIKYLTKGIITQLSILSKFFYFFNFLALYVSTFKFYWFGLLKNVIISTSSSFFKNSLIDLVVFFYFIFLGNKQC